MFQSRAIHYKSIMSNIEDEGSHIASLERSLAARLRTEREARGWSLSDLAQRSGVSRAMISKVERENADRLPGLGNTWRSHASSGRGPTEIQR